MVGKPDTFSGRDKPRYDPLCSGLIEEHQSVLVIDLTQWGAQSVEVIERNGSVGWGLAHAPDG